MSKWVETTRNNYRFVSDIDSRPAVELPDKEGVPYIAFTPSWKVHEPLMHSGDPKTESNALDAFVSEREQETKHSKKARDWEEGRKKNWDREKPNWAKKERTFVHEKS